ncbi:hypothetical protein ACIBO5_56370 [Nonomuraea angiospora]|uniref:hypothetical protein n=1 Tax=Nonomuraea angiospora TaxID=46172 RepID=UPI0037AA4185
MRSRIVFTTAVWGLAVALVVVVVRGHPDLEKVVTIWLSGSQTSGSTLWGLSMVWWGRAGKLLQFLAGCAVLLDLVGPERLRAAGASATGRWRGHRAMLARMYEQRPLVRLHHHVSGRIMRVSGSDIKDERLLMVDGTWPMEPLPDQPWITVEMTDGLRDTITASLPSAHACGSEHVHWYGRQPCDAQARYVRDRVREFVLAALPPRERELLAHSDRMARADTKGAAVCFVSGMAAFVVLLVTGRLATAHGLVPETVAAPGAVGIGFALFLASIFLALRKGPHVGLLPQLLAARIAGLVAAVLDRARPGHVLRWVAFVLFIAGFFLDLLAS